jgi:ABC-2 type transport system ATP-binding protein
MTTTAKQEATYALEVRNVSKAYASVQAVKDLSFQVKHGEIFGLLGHNGAGKTTTIRMVLDIIKPNAGEIRVLGGPMTEATKGRIGYLPEERGLYEDMTVMETLVFMGQLKGLSRADARERAETYLKEVELWDARDREIGDLSRGMNQKAQFVAATMHEPELIIIDEPFSGLDPVNTRIIKRLLYRMRDRGAAIVMSTHQMHQVEAMCERILLMDHGERVLYGPLDQIRRRFASDAIEVELQGDLSRQIPGVRRVTRHNGSYRMLLQEGTPPGDVLKTLTNTAEITVERFERAQASLDDIFVQIAGHGAPEADEHEEVTL